MPAPYRVEKWQEYNAPDDTTLSYSMAAEGYQVFKWCDRPGVEYGSHVHGEDQSHWIISGSLELTIERVGIFVLGPGDRDFMSAGTYHSARVVGKEPVTYLVGAKS